MESIMEKKTDKRAALATEKAEAGTGKKTLAEFLAETDVSPTGRAWRRAVVEGMYR